MSLTQEDLREIRQVVHSALQEVVIPRLDSLENEVKAIRNDIKEIYDMIAELQGRAITDEKFEKLPLEEKLLKINAELLVAAKQAGITLPR